jgi:hypothetical protein
MDLRGVPTLTLSLEESFGLRKMAGYADGTALSIK